MNYLVKIVSILNLVAITAFAQTLYNGVGHIDPNHQIEWTRAGLITAITPTMAIGSC